MVKSSLNSEKLVKSRICNFDKLSNTFNIILFKDLVVRFKNLRSEQQADKLNSVEILMKDRSSDCNGSDIDKSKTMYSNGLLFNFNDLRFLKLTRTLTFKKVNRLYPMSRVLRFGKSGHCCSDAILQ